MSPSLRLPLLILAAAAARPAHAQPAEAPAPAVAPTTEPDPLAGAPVEQEAESPWRTELRAWAWLMGVEGDVGVRGRTTEVSATIIDVLDSSDTLFAISGRLEVGYEKFGAFFDGMYADIGMEDQTGTAGRAAIDVQFEQTTIDFGLMYRIADVPPEHASAADNPRNLTLDLYAGGRYNGLDLEITPDRLPRRDAEKDWLDPIVGAKLVLPIASDWHAEVNADIGGFGAASDLTWSATAVVGYDFDLFGASATALLGYRIIGWDYSEGSGRDEFAWDLFQHGVILGLDVRF